MIVKVIAQFMTTLLFSSCSFSCIQWLSFSRRVFPSLLSLGLEDTARYAGLLPAPAEGFVCRPGLILPFGKKRSFYAVSFWTISVVTLVTVEKMCSNICNFKQKSNKSNKKSFIRDTKNLSTDADSSTDTKKILLVRQNSPKN